MSNGLTATYMMAASALEYYRGIGGELDESGELVKLIIAQGINLGTEGNVLDRAVQVKEALDDFCREAEINPRVLEALRQGTNQGFIMYAGKKESPVSLDPEVTISMVAAFYNVKPDELRSDSRVQHLVRPRHAAMYVLKHRHNLSMVEVGGLLGRDHSTVSFAVGKIGEQLTSDDRLAREIQGFMDQLG